MQKITKYYEKNIIVTVIYTNIPSKASLSKYAKKLKNIIDIKVIAS